MDLEGGATMAEAPRGGGCRPAEGDDGCWAAEGEPGVPLRCRTRTLSDAAKSVFGYQEVDEGEQKRTCRRQLRSPRLCCMLVGVFLVFTGITFCAVTFLWVRTAIDEEEQVSLAHRTIMRRYEKASGEAIDGIIDQLVKQDMNVEMLAVSEYINMPYLAVTMLGKAADQGILSLEGVDANIRHLWWVQTSLPSLEKNFAWGGIHKLETVYYADRFGLYASYVSDCANMDMGCDANVSYAFRFRPRDDAANTTCTKCPPGSPGRMHLYTVDEASGEIRGSNKSAGAYDPREGLFWKRAVAAPGATVWTEVHELSRKRHGEPTFGMAVARAFVEDGVPSMVVASSLTVDHITDILQRRVTLAAKHRAPDSNSVIFVIDELGRMVASSTGTSDVLCGNRSGTAACAGLQLMWYGTSCPLIKKAVANLHEHFPGFSNTSGIDSRSTDGYIYSYHRLETNRSNSDLHWIIIRAQPIIAYKAAVFEAKHTSQEDRQKAMERLQKTLASRQNVTFAWCGCFPVAGALGLSFVSWLVTRHVKMIAHDMKRVAKLDFDSLNRRARPDSIIHEVAKISKSFENMKTSLQSFTKYMDPCIVQVLVQSGQEARLGVAKAKVTVFFSDIASFTTMAETLEPCVLANVLGEYLEEMSRVIMEHDGIVGEFIGDEIMAWWNAPWDLGSQHAVLALAAALQQQQQLARLRQKWAEQGLPEVKARMGLVSGPVLAGNIGSRSRMKYGLVGDSVNLASRLEQLCKRYEVSVLVDSKTCDEPGVREAFFLRPVDLVTVKGRSEPTELYELVAAKEQVRGTPREDVHGRYCSDFAAIQDRYRRRDFQGALDAIADFQRSWPKDRPSSLLRVRCAALLECPPGPEWSAVEPLAEK